jgi:hypothetical protein
MCPRGGRLSPPAEDGEDNTSGETQPDPLAEWAVGLARQQAEERGEEAGEFDSSFIARALAESQRMRTEASKSQQKRAANVAQIAARHGEQGVSTIQHAMREHAALVLSPQAAQHDDDMQENAGQTMDGQDGQPAV